MMESLSSAWTGAIVDAFTQSGKTFKTFELLCAKVQPRSGTLVLSITQSNSVAAAHQILSRSRTHTDFPFDTIARVSELKNIETDWRPNADENWFLADFFNARNLGRIMQFLQHTAGAWREVIVIIDECDSGGVNGVWGRMQFVGDVERSVTRAAVRVILITATVANLSKSLLTIAHTHDITEGSIVHQLATERCVEHHFVNPHASYVGPSWFQETADVWKRLVYPTRSEMRESLELEKGVKITAQHIKAAKEKAVYDAIDNMGTAPKDLCLVVTSTRMEDHRRMAVDLLQHGFNVTVELNGASPSANYKVRYAIHGAGAQDDDNEYGVWHIPHTRLAALADRGDLATLTVMDTGSGGGGRVKRETGITCREDLTIGLLLQAALIMDTDLESDCYARVAGAGNGSNSNHWFALMALAQVMNSASGGSGAIPKKNRRPSAFPKRPRIALISGHLAGRGISIQDPRVGFCCTGFVFTHSPDKIQRGATNSQRFGRACGLFGEIFSDPARKPVLVATDAIMQDALANETVLKEKADSIENGELVSLRDLVTAADWDSVQSRIKKELAQRFAVAGTADEAFRVTACPIQKIRNGITIPDDAIPITEYSTVPWAEFEAEYSLQEVSPGNAAALAAALSKAGMDAHISIAEISARTVSDLVNFWRNPTWCHKQWQIIIVGLSGGKCTSVVCIWRDVQTLKTINTETHKGRIIKGHMPCGAIQGWRVK